MPRLGYDPCQKLCVFVVVGRTMLTASLNVPKPAGHAMVICGETSGDRPETLLKHLGYEVDRCEDPYAAMLELCRRPLVFRSVVLSLQSLYREELQIISAIRRRFPHISIWLTHTDGRQTALAEAMRLGAEGLVGEDGLYSFTEPSPAPVQTAPATGYRRAPTPTHVAEPPHEPEKPPPASKISSASAHEPVLSADELRALLGEEDHP